MLLSSYKKRHYALKTLCNMRSLLLLLLLDFHVLGTHKSTWNYSIYLIDIYTALWYRYYLKTLWFFVDTLLHIYLQQVYSSQLLFTFTFNALAWYEYEYFVCMSCALPGTRIKCRYVYALCVYVYACVQVIIIKIFVTSRYTVKLRYIESICSVDCGLESAWHA